MIWLVVGVALFSVVHLVPSVAPQARARFVERLGAGPFKGVFALLVVAAIVSMVFGWREVTPSPVYQPPAWGAIVTGVLLIVALILFFSPPKLTQLIRHPQLGGVVVWALAHLFANGDDRSLVLFGGLGLWAIVEILTVSRREGAWQRPGAGPFRANAIRVVLGLVAYAVIIIVHPYLFGVSPLPPS